MNRRVDVVEVLAEPRCRVLQSGDHERGRCSGALFWQNGQTSRKPSNLPAAMWSAGRISSA